MIWREEFLSAVADFLRTKESLRRKVFALDMVAIDDFPEPSIYWSKNLRLEEISSDSLSNRDSQNAADSRATLKSLLDNLVSVNKGVEKVEIDIRDIGGLCCAKNDGSWQNLGEFGRYINESRGKNKYYSIGCASPEEFEACIAHSFPTLQFPISVRCCTWSGGLFWMNSGGAHHAAAAHDYAVRTGQSFYLPSIITEFILNEAIVEKFDDMFVCFVVHASSHKLFNLLGMYDVPYQTSAFTRGFSSLRLIFVPRLHRLARAFERGMAFHEESGKAKDFAALLRNSAASQKYGVTKRASFELFLTSPSHSPA